MTDAFAAEARDIVQVMRDDRVSYDRDPAMQARLRDIYTAQETGEALLPAAEAGEIAQIQRLMRTDRRAYNKDTALQARYLQLLEQEAAAGELAAVDEACEFLTPSQWRKEGFEPSRYQEYAIVARAGADVMLAMDGDVRGQFSTSFMALPFNIQNVAMRAIVKPAAVTPEWFGEKDMAELTAIPSYRALAKEWGSDAPRKLGLLKERLMHALVQLPERDIRTAIAWIDRLPRSAMVAIGRKLAG